MKNLSRIRENVVRALSTRGTRRESESVRARGAEGQSLVEFVLVLPVLLVLVFGIIEFANAWRTSQIVTNAAREGARMAVLPDDPTPGEIETRVDTYLTNSGLDDSKATVTVECDTNNDGTFTSGSCGESGQAERINVKYDFTFSFLGPMINFMSGSGGDRFGTIELDATTIMRNE